MTKEEAIKKLRDLIQSDERILIQIPRSEAMKNEIKALNMAIKALEIVEEFEKAQIITGGRLNGRTYAYKCGIEDGKRKTLDRIKQARKEMAAYIEPTTGQWTSGFNNGVNTCNEILDKLIAESEKE